MGLEEERIRMVNIGAADARPFAEILRNMAETVKKLGPSPLNKNKAVPQEISQ
jgi:coenzyme F420-reducing hydrogenase delta subunit